MSLIDILAVVQKPTENQTNLNIGIIVVIVVILVLIASTFFSSKK